VRLSEDGEMLRAKKVRHEQSKEFVTDFQASPILESAHCVRLKRKPQTGQPDLLEEH